ncbi:MAG: type IV toxin-antitoxin system AbiEi family antitoxin domain-containing protein [Fibrella sp.]|nr:type IV toxin-antitoxin system AbiEi family antitoxin domain-containing protein [Armatimonadota bacterium]
MTHMTQATSITNEDGGGRAGQVLRFVRQAGLVRARDLATQGISPTHLQRLYERGLLERSGRGIYFVANETPVQGDDLSLAEVCLRVPHAVICLLSALRWHGLTTQAPHAVWIALPTRDHVPAIDYPAIRVVRMSDRPFTAGVEQANIGGATLRVYNPAKTVVDCFKFRNRIGVDVAIEALRECYRKRAASMDELWQYAQICRVANVMRPYLESVAAQ